MGVTKKPAVIAKTAAKKRGRPAGSKNKPKDKTALIYAGDERLPKFKGEKPVDWEKLCKQLQGALAAQIKETDQYKRLFEQFEATSTRVNSLSLWQRITLVFTGKI